ncbi:MAG: insulinase family protein [Minwuiales bacterium]|nr:insulinase family protein [Minwuiales bacterium]
MRKIPFFRFILPAVALTMASVSAPSMAADITRVVSPGGIEAWLVNEPSIPIISLEVAWEGGARLDPEAKTGLANMVSGLLDEGAGDMDSAAFQAKLKDLAIGLSFNAGKDTFRGSLRTLTKNRDEAFALFAQAITKPRFDQAAVERIRGQILVGIARDRTNPRSLVGRGWFSAAYPNDGYGRPTDGTEESVQAIEIADLKQFVADRLARDNLTIGVVGDIAPDALATLLDKTFGGLPENARDGTGTDVWPVDDPDLQVIEQQTPQSVVMFGMRGLKRDDPDYYAAYVMNYVLGGGGLTSRLAESVREKRGLTYSIFSYLNPLAETALYMGGFSSSNETVAQAIDLTRAEFVRMRDDGVTEEELADAKTYLNGSFPLRLTSNSRIAQTVVAMQRQNLGIDYLDRRPDYINAVTAEDVRRVAKRLLRPENLRVVVVGNPKGLSQGG